MSLLGIRTGRWQVWRGGCSFQILCCLPWQKDPVMSNWACDIYTASLTLVGVTMVTCPLSTVKDSTSWEGPPKLLLARKPKTDEKELSSSSSDSSRWKRNDHDMSIKPNETKKKVSFTFPQDRLAEPKLLLGCHSWLKHPRTAIKHGLNCGLFHGLGCGWLP